LLSSVFSFTQTPEHTRRGETQLQTPDTHVKPVPQSLPHEPQLFASV
jgi:hypothetical protein